MRDEGDPLLFIESVPYYETRAYLNAVLRNYFVYQMAQQGTSPVLQAMAQGCGRASRRQEDRHGAHPAARTGRQCQLTPMPIDEALAFKPVNIAVLTVSDTRTFADDRSGNTLAERITAAGHVLKDRAISKTSAK